MVFDLNEAYEKGIYQAREPSDRTKTLAVKMRELTRQAPNLTLNVPGALSNSTEVRFFALVGVLIQVLILVISAFTTYHWKLRSGGSSVATYGYPCFLVGMLTTAILDMSNKASKAYQSVPGSEVYPKEVSHSTFCNALRFSTPT